MSKRPYQIGLAAALLTVSLSAAHAEVSGDQSREVVYGTSPQTRTQQVPFGDLNLANEVGRTILKDRVSQAVETVCGGRIIDFIDQTQVQGIRRCRAASMADAMLKVQSVIAAFRTPRSVASTISVFRAGG
jgi:UrcA family protein